MGLPSAPVYEVWPEHLNPRFQVAFKEQQSTSSLSSYYSSDSSLSAQMPFLSLDEKPESNRSRDVRACRPDNGRLASDAEPDRAFQSDGLRNLDYVSSTLERPSGLGRHHRIIRICKKADRRREEECQTLTDFWGVPLSSSPPPDTARQRGVVPIRPHPPVQEAPIRPQPTGDTMPRARLSPIYVPLYSSDANPRVHFRGRTAAVETVPNPPKADNTESHPIIGKRFPPAMKAELHVPPPQPQPQKPDLSLGPAVDEGSDEARSYTTAKEGPSSPGPRGTYWKRSPTPTRNSGVQMWHHRQCRNRSGSPTPRTKVRACEGCKEHFSYPFAYQRHVEVCSAGGQLEFSPVVTRFSTRN